MCSSVLLFLHTTYKRTVYTVILVFSECIICVYEKNKQKLSMYNTRLRFSPTCLCSQFDYNLLSDEQWISIITYLCLTVFKLDLHNIKNLLLIFKTFVCKKKCNACNRKIATKNCKNKS